MSGDDSGPFYSKFMKNPDGALSGGPVSRSVFFIGMIGDQGEEKAARLIDVDRHPPGACIIK